MAKTGPKNTQADPGVADEQSIFQHHVFEEEVFNVKRPNPDIEVEGTVESQGPGIKFNLSDVFDYKEPDTTVQSVLAPLFKEIILSFNKPRAEDSYENNFIINLHNFNYPVPIPLQTFTYGVDLMNSKEAPYQSVQLGLQLPAAVAMNLFAGPDMSPEPGHWIVIRQRPNDPNNSPLDEVWGASSGKKMDNLQFIGTISSIDYDINVDEMGNQTCNISVLANSFIHNLMYAEYKVKPSGMVDQELSELPGEEDMFVQSGAYSSSYMINWSDWYSLIQFESQAASGKVNLKDSLTLLSKALAYPQLPLSIFFEPMDMANFLNQIAESNLDLDTFAGRLALRYDTPTVQLVLRGVLSVYEIIAIDSPLVNYTKVKSLAAQLFAKYINSGAQENVTVFGPLRPDDTRSGFGIEITPGEDTLTEIDTISNMLLETNLEAYNTPIKISDIIHIATTRDDIPPSHPMWGCMPHEDLPFVDINRIKNVNMETTTVWDLLTGTFQADSNIVEFYPTILTISDRDLEYYKQQNIEIKPIHRFLGGLPTLILRMKPMHPVLGRYGISKRMIDMLKSRNKAQGSLHSSAVQPMQYLTAAETMKDTINGRKLSEYKDASYGEVLPYYVNPQISSTNPDYIRAVSLPAMIYSHEIISMSYNLNDRARINSVKVINPQTKNMGTKLRYAVDGNAVQDVPSAVRHGLRSYDPVWPYNEFRSSPTAKPDANETPNYKTLNTYLSERCYMIMGDDQKYFAGSIVSMSLINKGISPGQWVEVVLSNNGTLKEATRNQRIMLIYVDSINHMYDVDQDTGVVELKTIIGFSRGSMGGVIPNFPFFRGPHIPPLKEPEDDYVFDDPIDTNEDAPGSNVDLPEITPIVRQETITELALRHYVRTKVLAGTMLPSEAKQIVEDANVDALPKDEMPLFEAIKTRFGMATDLVNQVMDPDGTPNE